MLQELAIDEVRDNLPYE